MKHGVVRIEDDAASTALSWSPERKKNEKLKS